MGKIIISVLAVGVVIYFGVRFMKGETPSEMAEGVKQDVKNAQEDAKNMKENVQEGMKGAAEKLPPNDSGQVKEFAMDSYFDDKGVWFSVKEIRVNKGDRVRIAVTNIKGTHDFTLDEFGVKQETPLNETTTIEFVADKAGTFEYYCSKPGHRAKGQWGKLMVE